jgi:hypothetical protein
MDFQPKSSAKTPGTPKITINKKNISFFNIASSSQKVSCLGSKGYYGLY